MTLRWQGFVVPAILLAAAEIAADASGFQSDAIVPPSAVFSALMQALVDGEIYGVTLQTLAAVGAGLAIGCTIGLVLGILLGLFWVADRLFEFPVEALRPIPAVALIPVVMLIFGLGYDMEISLVSFATMWPILILSRAAVVGIEPRLMEVSRLLGFGLGRSVLKIVLPAVLPRLFVALRLAVGVALVVAVTVEVAANPFGLGYAMMTAEQSLHPALMLALLLWIGLVGWCVNAGLLWAQRRLFGPAALVEATP
jgi:NitT/TauT family transport system permease protein